MIIVKNIRFQIIVLLFILMLAATTHAAVTATVDRTTIAQDETVNLTISKDSSRGSYGPDLAVIEKNFKVLGQNQSSSTQITNGTVTSSVKWNIVLAPKHIGTLQIPAITVGKEKTRPLQVKVVRQVAPKTKAADASIFLETDVDSRSVYVQSQLIYTLRIYAVSGAQVQDPGVPKLQDAIVKKLNDTSFEKRIDGQMYKVFELRFAVFPQKSGTFELPQMVVQATLPRQQQNRNFYDPFGRQGKKVKLRSMSEKITVKETPASYPQGATWLPTERLSIVDKWSRNPRSLKVGESTTLTIDIAGVGLLGIQLPPVEIDDVDSLKLYQGKAEVKNHQSSDGITGVRKESIALIPTKQGSLKLPEIRVPWWNKRDSKVEYAIVPSREVIIAGGLEQPVPASAVPVIPLTSTPESLQGAVPVMIDGGASRILIVACVILTIMWLVTLLLLLRTRRELSLLASGVIRKDEEVRGMREREAFKLLQNSCGNNDPLAARNALVIWAKTAWPQYKINALADLLRAEEDPELAIILQDIDKHLYSQDENGKKWQGNSLQQKIKERRKNRKKSKDGSVVLEPLYK